MTALVTLLSDFGYRDSFVGAMRGVILGRCPTARLVDLTHGVPPQDVGHGAWQLRRAWPCFPTGTIHCAVVDPGVGSERRVLAAQVEGQTIVCPDNGLLDLARGEHTPDQVLAVDRPDLYRQPVSVTFHGRDIFAPVTGFLAAGGPLAALGPAIDDWVRADLPAAIISEERCSGAIICQDGFGNLITNLPADHALTAIEWQGRRFPTAACYAAVDPGQPLCVRGSDGFWELAVNGGSAAELGLPTGDQAVVGFMPEGG